MASYQELKRLSLLPLLGLALTLYYLFAYVPLAQRAESLDEPVQKAWRKLTASLDQTNAVAINFQLITNQLKETRRALAVVQSAKKQAAARLELPPALRAKLNASFQLVDYENERSQQMDQLARQAAKQQVTIDPAVFAGFPEHTTDVQEPALLWAALSLTDDLLDAAVACQVTAIHSLDVPLALTNTGPADLPGHWAEIPVQVEFTASASNALRLVQTLPLRAEEIRAAGLPETPPGKLPLFIDRLIIRKQAPEKLDEVRVGLRAVGFVLRE
jgi:hypothetical protein